MNNKIEEVLDTTKIFEETFVTESVTNSTPIKIQDANCTDLSEPGLSHKFLMADFKKENNIN